MTDYRDGTIHGWNGGECPVHPKDEVTVWLREGSVGQGLAGGFVWCDTTHDLTRPSDIVCFCVTKKHEEPLTLWVNIYPSGCPIWGHTTEEAARQHAERYAIRIAVKVQEVKE